MAATEYDLNPAEVELEDEKPVFNALSFDGLIQRINVNPDLLSKSWRELVKSEFRLTPEQELSLIDVSDKRVQEIQSSLSYFGQEITRGGSINGRIIKRPIEEQTPEAVHGIQLELRLPETGVVKMLRIAHCDANCRNWRWNSF